MAQPAPPPLSAELLARTSQANMADHMMRYRVRWLGHAARKPNDVMVKQLLFAHSIPIGRPHLTWMDTAMHDMDSLGRTLQIDLPPLARDGMRKKQLLDHDIIRLAGCVP